MLLSLVVVLAVAVPAKGVRPKSRNAQIAELELFCGVLNCGLNHAITPLRGSTPSAVPEKVCCQLGNNRFRNHCLLFRERCLFPLWKSKCCAVRRWVTGARMQAAEHPVFRGTASFPTARLSPRCTYAADRKSCCVPAFFAVGRCIENMLIRSTSRRPSPSSSIETAFCFDVAFFGSSPMS